MTEYTSISDIIIHLHYCFCSDLVRDDAYIILDDTYVQSGSLGDYDEPFCIKEGLKEIQLNRPGGTLIFFKGDFAYGHYGEDAQEFTTKWREFLVAKLKNRGLNAVVSNNDILIDDNKITGTVVMRNKMALGLVSINPDAELIRKVCLKPSTNNFQGLSKYGLTAENVKTWFVEFQSIY